MCLKSSVGPIRPLIYSRGWIRNDVALPRKELLSLRVRQLNFAQRTIRLNRANKDHEGREVTMTQVVRQILGECLPGKQSKNHMPFYRFLSRLI
jgi:hypothetical protein